MPTQKTAKKREKSYRKKAQPYRLSDWVQDKFSFLQQFLCCAVLPLVAILAVVVAAVVVGEKRESSQRT